MRIFYKNLTEIPLDRTNLTWDGLKDNKFVSTNRSKEWLDVTSDRFINWMMPNTYPSTYKGWFRPTQMILKGEYVFQVKNMLDHNLFKGSKYFGFEEYSPIGAKNLILTQFMFLIFLMSSTLTCFFYRMISKEEKAEKIQTQFEVKNPLAAPLMD